MNYDSYSIDDVTYSALIGPNLMWDSVRIHKFTSHFIDSIKTIAMHTNALLVSRLNMVVTDSISVGLTDVRRTHIFIVKDGKSNFCVFEFKMHYAKSATF